MASILVVDDELHVTRVMRMALERAGHEVEVAGDGCEALEHLGKRTFDVLITDITMPHMTGLELCERVREEPKNEGIRIFVMTSRVEDEFRDQAARFEQLEFVEKPVSLRRLLARLDQRLDESERELAP